MRFGKLLKHVPEEIMGPEIRWTFTEPIASVVEIPRLVGFDLSSSSSSKYGFSASARAKSQGPEP